MHFYKDIQLGSEYFTSRVQIKPLRGDGREYREIQHEKRREKNKNKGEQCKVWYDVISCWGIMIIGK
jgi:hypothetical protein